MTIEPQQPPPEKGPPKREPLRKPRAKGADRNGHNSTPPIVSDTPPRGKLGKALYERISFLGVIIAGTGDYHCGQILMSNAASLATAWSNLAKQNKQVEEWLERFVSGGAWGDAVFATLAVAYPIAQHHVPIMEAWPNPFALVPPSEEVQEHGSNDSANGGGTGT